MNRSNCTAVLAAVLCLAVQAVGAELVMDAAEVDLEGNPLPAPIVLPIYDNRDSLVDATGVSFQIGYTGTVYGLIGLQMDEYPWQATYPQGGGYRQTLGTREYTLGMYLDTRTATWGPAMRAHLLADDPEYRPFEEGNEIYPDPVSWDMKYNWRELAQGVVPAGIIWYMGVKLAGENIVLFHSPAEGQFADGDGSHAVFDADRSPQLALVPEPSALVALLAGCLLRRKRRWRQPS